MFAYFECLICTLTSDSYLHISENLHITSSEAQEAFISGPFPFITVSFYLKRKKPSDRMYLFLSEGITYANQRLCPFFPLIRMILNNKRFLLVLNYFRRRRNGHNVSDFRASRATASRHLRLYCSGCRTGLCRSTKAPGCCRSSSVLPSSASGCRGWH